MNQKKELLTYHVALLEYERDCITAWHFWLERKTKPVLAKTEKCFRLYLDNKARKGRGDEEWGILRDSLLHKNLEKMFENTPFFCRLSGRQRVRRGMDGQIFSFSVQKTEKFSRRQSLHHGSLLCGNGRKRGDGLQRYALSER